MSESHKGVMVGENHPFYGKHHTEESRKKMSTALKGKPSAFKGRHHSAESIEINRKKNIDSRNEVKQLYIAYKSNGGILKWNDFQKIVKDGSLIPFEYNFETGEYKPAVEEIKDKELHPGDSVVVEDYIPEIAEDDYDYMQ
jgi:NUMOD3 motif.